MLMIMTYISLQREVQPLVQLNNPTWEWFIVKYHNNNLCHACWIWMCLICAVLKGKCNSFVLYKLPFNPICIMRIVRTWRYQSSFLLVAEGTPVCAHWDVLYAILLQQKQLWQITDRTKSLISRQYQWRPWILRSTSTLWIMIKSILPFTLGKFWVFGYCLCLRLCVCVSLCVNYLLYAR